MRFINQFASFDHIEKILKSEIQSIQEVSGGDISQAFLLQTEKGNFFIKTNKADFALDMFEKEAKGLALLTQTKTIRTPEIIKIGEEEEYAFLLMEYMEPGIRKDGFWETFGQSLAALHRHNSDQFGLDHENYIGSFQQLNSHYDNFSEFYIYERLQPQFEIAFNDNRLNKSDRTHLTNLFQQLPSIIPSEPPALIHGDLWSGNFLVGKNNQPVLIDPSVAYSHREIDLAMSRLFGGFDRSFYSAYEEAFPLEPGFEKRLPIYQLYYLLVHVNLFGGGYVGSVRRILGAFK